MGISRNTVFAAALIMACVFSGGASALSFGAPFTYDNGAGYLDGLIGDGIGNIGYAIHDNSSGIVVGVKAHPRYTASVLPYTNGDYFANVGMGEFPNETPYPGLTNWNVSWAVEIDDGVDTSALEFRWILDFDNASGNSNFATMHIPVAAGTPGQGYADGAGSQFWAGDQNLGFNYWTDLPESDWNTYFGITWSNFGDISDIDPFATGEYFMAFEVYDSGNSEVLARSEMTVQVAPVPEPASMTLLGLGVLGIAIQRRRKK